MLFNSFEFLIFFPVVTTLYFLLPHKYRWALLLSASAIFYMMFIPSYILILGATIIVDFFAGRWIENENDTRRRKNYLILSLIVNVGFLAFFKYFNFFTENINLVADMIGWNYSIQALNIVLPIGLSFHTFQAMSYTIEVYRGKQKAERNFGIYALYVLFYPQLVAGPIERPQNILHQFYEEHFFDYQRVTDGLKLMIWGLYKKVVIADRLAPITDRYYQNFSQHSGPEMAFATLCFSIQIFCDFSGYSDIAIGAAQVMGFKLMNNFKRPYLALSFSEFWNRWHISLSAWFRDYVFFPMRRSFLLKKTLPSWVVDIIPPIITMLISGLWHGAQWTFVLWGGIHGLYIVIENQIKSWTTAQPSPSNRSVLPKWVTDTLQRLFIFVCVGYAWIFFRAPSLEAAFHIARNVFTGWTDFPAIYEVVHNLSADYELLITMIAIALMGAVHYFQEQMPLRATLARKPLALRWTLYTGILAFILFFGRIYATATDFIYFQF